MATSTEKRTPGKWVTKMIGVSSAGPHGIGVYEVNNGRGSLIAEHLTEADARLIAAAPELLDRLKTLTNTLASVHGEEWETVKQARAAIAKATA